MIEKVNEQFLFDNLIVYNIRNGGELYLYGIEIDLIIPFAGVKNRVRNGY